MSAEIPVYEGFVDSRGEIRDLLRDVKLDSVTLIRTKAGAVRGNHFHAQTTQWLYIVSGLLEVQTSVGGATLEPGDMWIDEPNVRHAWRALKDTVTLVFTQGLRSGLGYESDTQRLSDAERLI